MGSVRVVVGPVRVVVGPVFRSVGWVLLECWVGPVRVLGGFC